MLSRDKISYFIFLTFHLRGLNSANNESEQIFNKQFINTDGTVRTFLLTELMQPWGSRNTVVSPAAALLSLGQLHFGADAATKKEIEVAFGTTQITEFLTEIVDRLPFENTVKMGMYLVTVIPWMYEVTPSYKKAISSIFDFHLQHADFSNRTKVAQYANLLIEDITGGIINKIIKPSEITADTSLVLLGATFFKGDWATKFSLEKERALFSAYEENMFTRYMTTEMEAFYVKSDVFKAEIIQFPFKGNKVAFTIFLPFEINGLKSVLDNINTYKNKLKEELQKMEKKVTKISLPRFKIESQMDMIKILKKLGVERIFEKHNSGLNSVLLATKPWVSRIKQKIKLVCNQNAVSAIDKQLDPLLYSRAKAIPEVVFKANHPFLFYVLYKEEQLFSGTINKPNTPERYQSNKKQKKSFRQNNDTSLTEENQMMSKFISDSDSENSSNEETTIKEEKKTTKSKYFKDDSSVSENNEDYPNMFAAKRVSDLSEEKLHHNVERKHPSIFESLPKDLSIRIIL